jgi:hypothetical protein
MKRAARWRFEAALSGRQAPGVVRTFFAPFDP